MRIAYASISLIYGLSLLIAAFTWKLLPIPFLQTDAAMGIAFVVSGVMAIPCIKTYTELGLNSPEDTEPSVDVKMRHAALRRACPLWPVAWYSGQAFLLCAFMGSVLFQLPIHFFFAFSAVISCLTGIWFFMAYPIALREFDSVAQR